MKGLNKISILECDEITIENHRQEVEKIMNKISEVRNYDCTFDIEYVDEYHKNHRDKVTKKDDFHNVSDVLDCCDFKNGMDTYVDQEKLIFMVYGGTYDYQGKNYLIETKVTVTAFDRYGYPVNMENLFIEKEKKIDRQSL